MSKRISADWLRAKGACKDQYGLFLKTFPGGADVTEASLRHAAFAGLDIDWFARKYLPASALAEYERVKAPALAEYERVTVDTLISLIAEMEVVAC